MSVLAFDINDKFSLRLFAHELTNPSQTWVNSFEFVANSTGAVSDLEECASAVMTYMKEMTGNTIYYDRAVFSTWEPDSDPYDPTNLVTFDYGAQAGIIEIANPLPVNACLSMRRSVSSGRSGKIFIRGALGEIDVLSSAGDWALATPATLVSRHGGAMIQSDLGHYIGGPVLSMALIGIPKGTQTVIVRPVTELVVHGVAWNQRNHRYFDRA